MSAISISPYRLLPTTQAFYAAFKPSFKFSSTGPDLGCRQNGLQYSFGTHSDWSADAHDLTAICNFSTVSELSILFGDRGVVGNGGTLLLALEWESADSGYRCLGNIEELTLDKCNSQAPITLNLALAAGSIRGIGTVTLQVFLKHPDPIVITSGFAQTPGFRFGVLARPITVVIDSDSSLFPILEQSGGRDRALWEFQETWIDPLEDEFTADYVALVLNTDHENFDKIYERHEASLQQTPLMRQILAAWIAILIFEIHSKLGRDFEAIVGGDTQIALPGSIAYTAALFARTGQINTSSLPSIVASSQQWIDQTMRNTEASR